MNKVFVGSLSWNTKEDGLRDFFSQVGEIEDVKVITDRVTGRARGFGFVTFTNAEDAQKAIESLDGAELDGRNLKVNLAEDKRRTSGGGGSSSGGFSRRGGSSFSGGRKESDGNRW